MVTINYLFGMKYLFFENELLKNLTKIKIEFIQFGLIKMKYRLKCGSLKKVIKCIIMMKKSKKSHF